MFAPAGRASEQELFKRALLASLVLHLLCFLVVFPDWSLSRPLEPGLGVRERPLLRRLPPAQPRPLPILKKRQARPLRRKLVPVPVAVQVDIEPVLDDSDPTELEIEIAAPDLTGIGEGCDGSWCTGLLTGW